MDTLSKIALKIIQEQELIIGPLAWAEASKVHGIKIINQQNAEISIGNGDQRSVIDRLVNQYERLFGGASREVCREAASPFLTTLNPAEIPSSLK